MYNEEDVYMYIDRFNGTTLMEREEEAEKEPAAQAPSLLMQGEEVHKPNNGPKQQQYGTASRQS